MNPSIKGIGSAPIQPQVPDSETLQKSQTSENSSTGFDSKDRLEPQVGSNTFSDLEGKPRTANSDLQQMQSQLDGEKPQKIAQESAIEKERAAQMGSTLQAVQEENDAKEKAWFWDSVLLGPVERGVEKGIVDFAQSIAQDADQIGKGISKFVQDPGDTAAKAAEAAADAAEKAAEKAAEDAAKAAQQAAQDAVDAVTQAIQDAANAAEQAAEDAANAAAQAAQDVLNAAEDAASDAADDAKKFFGF